VSFQAERAVAEDGSVDWVVVDIDSYDLHIEATAFLAGLRARDCSPNTARAYAGRVAVYLIYCASNRLDWRTPGFLAMKRFKDWLVSEPVAPRSRRPVAPRYRSEGSANAVLTAVCEFLRFGYPRGWVQEGTVAMLAEPKYLTHLPAGYSAGEDDQFRVVGKSTFRFRMVEPGYEALTFDQLNHMIELAGNARDRFLVAVLGCTGCRIGEALGLRREDMHLLPDSQDLGCPVTGPHVHIRRRPDNANKALAKARKPRSIPVTDDLVQFYSDYRYDRDQIDQAADCDLVFVNCYRPPLGRPMTYDNAKEMFERLARAAGFTARPHMLRHGAATQWLRDGTHRDVVQELLGHVSQASMQPYIHVSDQEKRDAVERVGVVGRSAG
jgi:integrase/recombinase XerD